MAMRLSPILIVSPYPDGPWRGLTATLYLVAIIGLTSMIQARLPGMDSRGKWVALEHAKLSLLLLLVNSLLFVFCAALVSLGVWENGAVKTCTAIFWLCMLCYGCSKAVITWFLIERVHVVHGNLKRRRESKLYLGNLFLMLGWVAVAIPSIIFNRSGIGSDGSCSLTASDYTMELAIAVDLFTDLYLGLLFIVPLFRGTWHSSRLRGIAVRSSVASVISMCSTVTNLSLWIGMHGSEISWMCLAICTLDTVVNATALFALTYKESPVESDTVPAGCRWSGRSGGAWVPRSEGASLPYRSQLVPDDPETSRGDLGIVVPFHNTDYAEESDVRRSSDKVEVGKTMRFEEEYEL